MNLIHKKILCIVIVCVCVLLCFMSSNVYAVTQEQELKEVLDEYSDSIGDKYAFRQVLDNLYKDITQATIVDDTLKTTLLEDLSKLDEVDMDPALLMVLKLELQSQINNLTNENKHEVEELFKVMRDWADEKIEAEKLTPVPEQNNNVNKMDNTLADSDIPQAGENILLYLLIMAVVTILATIGIKYKDSKF